MPPLRWRICRKKRWRGKQKHSPSLIPQRFRSREFLKSQDEVPCACVYHRALATKNLDRRTVPPWIYTVYDSISQTIFFNPKHSCCESRFFSLFGTFRERVSGTVLHSRKTWRRRIIVRMHRWKLDLLDRMAHYWFETRIAVTLWFSAPFSHETVRCNQQLSPCSWACQNYWLDGFDRWRRLRLITSLCLLRVARNAALLLAYVSKISALTPYPCALAVYGFYN